MKPRHRLFVLTIITFTFCGCKSNTTQVTTLPPADNVDSNTLPNKPTNNDKQKLLDKALEISGKKLSAEEQNVVMRMLNLNEKDVIRGLGVWLELLDGEYPNSLNPKVALKQAEALWRAKHGGVSPEKTKDKEKKKEAEETIYDIFFASAFYDKLIREKKDVAYYGDKISVEDSDKVLMRWKISSGRYRVVFGNLTRKSVTAEELTELEKPPSK
jgi:hypothetical protein